MCLASIGAPWHLHAKSSNGTAASSEKRGKEEGEADAALEFGEGLGEGGLGNVEALRGLGEGTGALYLAEVGELLGLKREGRCIIHRKYQCIR